MRRFVIALTVFAAMSVLATPAALAGNGNGAPSGPHFTLNIHGVANGQGFNGNNQNDIFVPLGTTGTPARCDIMLQQSLTYDFGVTQPNCIGQNAQFSLPAPCAIDPTTATCSSSYTLYSVYARALGKPGPGVQATLTSCFIDSTGTQYCSTNGYVAVRGSGPVSKFSNVSDQLLFISGPCVKGTGGTGSTVTPIFGNSNYQYLWQYDNQGLRLLQLRFYQVPTQVPAGITC